MTEGEKMAKIPKDPAEIFPEITDDFKKVFESDLISLILYGSGSYSKSNRKGAF